MAAVCCYTFGYSLFPMIDGLPNSLPERRSRVSSHFAEIQSRLVGVAALVLSLAACSAAPEQAPTREPVRRGSSSLGEGVWVSLEPDRVRISPLTEAEADVERAVFRQVLLQGRMIRQQVTRVAEIQEAFKTAQEGAKESLALELTQASFDLEVAAFNLFGDIRKVSPRAWARLLRVLRAVTDGTVTVASIDELSLQQFGDIEASADTSISRKAISGLYTEQVKFLALMVARLDRNMAELRRQFDAADPVERENLQGVIHTLERQQSDLMGLIERGDIFPVVPAEAERPAWEQRVFNIFQETRQGAGGRDGCPRAIRFGAGLQQPSSADPVGPRQPSLPPAPVPAPREPLPEQEQPAPRQEDYRPRVV